MIFYMKVWWYLSSLSNFTLKTFYIQKESNSRTKDRHSQLCFCLRPGQVGESDPCRGQRAPVEAVRDPSSCQRKGPASRDMPRGC